jgi:hypothetical protein
MTFQLLHSEFPYIWRKFDFLFYQCVNALLFCLIAGQLTVLFSSMEYRARICKPFKKPRNRFLAWQNRFLASLKGPKHEIFESGFLYTNQTCTGRWLGDWRKKMKFRKLECLFEGFCYEYLIKRTISMRLITKKMQDSPPKKVVWDALGTLF